MEEALTRVVDSQQLSIRMIEPEKAVHVEGKNLRDEINHTRQEVSRSEKRLKEYLARNLSRMKR